MFPPTPKWKREKKGKLCKNVCLKSLESCGKEKTKEKKYSQSKISTKMLKYETSNIVVCQLLLVDAFPFFVYLLLKDLKYYSLQILNNLTKKIL